MTKKIEFLLETIIHQGETIDKLKEQLKLTTSPIAPEEVPHKSLAQPLFDVVKVGFNGLMVIGDHLQRFADTHPNVGRELSEYYNQKKIVVYTR